MKNLRGLGVASLIGILGYLAIDGRSSVVAQSGVKPPPSVRWEYKLLNTASEQQFNVLGGSGWELCDVVEHGGQREDQRVTFIFKRERR